MNPRTEADLPPHWATLQDILVREILAEMGRRRMTARALCDASGISTSHWSEMKNLKKPMSLDKLSALAAALDMQVRTALLRA